MPSRPNMRRGGEEEEAALPLEYSKIRFHHATSHDETEYCNEVKTKKGIYSLLAYTYLQTQISLLAKKKNEETILR
jgi:hypothetical protein